MANNSNIPAGKSLAELIAENEALTAKVKLLESASKLTISVESKKYGQGTVSLSGMQRFPLSLHPAQWAELFTVAPGKIRDYMEKNAEHIRASAAASEYALESLKLAKIPEKTDATRKAYEDAWDKAYTLALADKAIMPKNKKFRSVPDVLASWK